MSWISDAPGVQPDGVPDEGGVVLGGDLQLELAAPVALVVLLPGVRKFILVVYVVDFFKYFQAPATPSVNPMNGLQACFYKHVNTSLFKSHM